METYEDHPWHANSHYGAEEEGKADEEEQQHRDRHLAKVRARSNSRSRRRSSFLVDELDMLMDNSATAIQAVWRGHLVRKELMSQHAAATTIQTAWRRFIAREYQALQRDQVPSRAAAGRRRRTPSLSSFEEEKRRRERVEMERHRAAVVIQAHYRGYVTRRALAECHQAATTIQAHWRGYCTRRELALMGYTYRPASPEMAYYSPAGTPKGTYYGHPSYMPGSSAWIGPYPRKHWCKSLVGDPEEWARVVPRAQPLGFQQKGAKASQPKTCPRCGRCTSIRVLVGVGKGPPSGSEMEDSECEGHATSSPSARRRSLGSRPTGRQESSRSHPYGAYASYQTPQRSYYAPAQNLGAEDQPRTPGREPGGLSPRLASSMHPSPRLTRGRTSTRCFSSTSLQQPPPPAGMPIPGSSDWLYENYLTRRMGEGQKRVFKTRKQMWQVIRAATLIQSYWRGWKVRQTLRIQEEAAIKIQSAYRGYRTRVYLTEVGVLSEGDTE